MKFNKVPELFHCRMGDVKGHTATVSFTVSVADIADETPVINGPVNMSTIYFYENDEVSGVFSLPIIGTDGDAGETLAFNFTSSDPTATSIFQLSSVSGNNTGAQATLELVGSKTLDFETAPNAYDIEVLWVKNSNYRGTNTFQIINIVKCMKCLVDFKEYTI